MQGLHLTADRRRCAPHTGALDDGAALRAACLQADNSACAEALLAAVEAVFAPGLVQRRRRLRGGACEPGPPR